MFSFLEQEAIKSYIIMLYFVLHLIVFIANENILIDVANSANIS